PPRRPMDPPPPRVDQGTQHTHSPCRPAAEASDRGRPSQEDLVTARTIRRRPSAAPTVLVTAFVSLLAAGAGGCKSVSTPTATRGNAPSELRQKAGLASVSIPNDAHRGAFTNQTYFEQGREVQLPQRWVTEARVATAESEARRGAAEAFRVRADADFADSTAQA